MIGLYRKIHLFDIDIPGKITFKESDALTGGKSFVSFSTPWTEIGIGICYDIRFADLAQIYARDHNCGLLVYPGAFNMTTGMLDQNSMSFESVIMQKSLLCYLLFSIVMMMV